MVKNLATDIIVKGARVHNLKNVSLTLPRDKFIVFTGLSGSGKSSLAFDTIYAEGHRRFVESLSSYARQFLGQLDKPDVDSIEGLSPAISIDQKTTSKNPRSTVGTVTEIYDYMRLLYARIGIPHCPICGEVIKQQSVDEIVDRVMSLDEGTRFMVLAPVVNAKKGLHEKVLEDAARSGYVRARIDGSMYELTENIQLDKNKKHDIDIVVDRLIMKKESLHSRLTDSIETAATLSGGIVKVLLSEVTEDESEKEMVFSQNYACKTHGISLGELAPRMFSFNSPFGACEACSGLGENYVVSPDKLVPEKNVSLFGGAVLCNGFKSIESGSYFGETLNTIGKFYGFDIHKPIKDYTAEAQSILFHGNLNKQRVFGEPKFEGIINMVKRRYDTNTSFEAREYYEEFMENVPCPHCEGKRLKKESLAVTVGDKNISDLCNLSITNLKKFFEKLKLTKTETAIAKEITKEINERLGFLHSVGLDYLTLGRRAGSLSGGEAQRIRLATQIGSSLVGVLYILDEPSIGLHQRDNQKLIDTLKRLRDIGNTLIIVEHDEETMLASDYLVDIGPKAGIHGGQVIFTGTPQEIINCEESLTGQYLSGKKFITIPEKRREGNGKLISVIGANENNLKNIDVSFPLGCLVCVTGVSGSGKSSLVNAILYKALGKMLGRNSLTPGKFKEIKGAEEIDKIIAIDQSPIGRTPRSNPATYTGLFADIRGVFAATPEARQRGYKDGRFSFNVKGGRCEACEGDGTIMIEMHFLPDVYVTCDVCKGKRYNRETLEVKYKNKNIYDVLEMTVDEGKKFFENYPSIHRRLQTLSEVGLGYIKIGQSSTTLSGGEAQRVKLATELSKRSTGRTMYILDEPTTGLHTYDVDKLREVLQRLVDAGNTVVVIEHNLDLIKTSDYIIDMGPEGGDGGGTVVASGTPEQVAAYENSYTGKYLKKALKGR
ncbi:MAG: excinuclease ABC subunit A [Clostridiales bacterium GWF2_36_10]|nr:MAG: excinuclease ABC subunit A [Clostridiales bacterium GWF2_36_10]HAN21306.1 excinuclease ABC subunit UvrA [Clostridiales bacterium]